MDDAQIAEHLEDLYATLRGDMQLLTARHGMSANDLIALDADALQCLLAGHPKFVFNKGRRGWGLTALQQYAPEYQGQFQLHWVAAKRSSFVWCIDEDFPLEDLLNSAMDIGERQRFDRRWHDLKLNNDWLPVPLHPWQWQQKIALHFLPQLASGELVELGEFGDRYLAQQSLRTLTNTSRRVPFDIKLPLTIYNTSCYRGIPASTSAPGLRLHAGYSRFSPVTAPCRPAAPRSWVNRRRAIWPTQPTAHCPRPPIVIRKCSE